MIEVLVFAYGCPIVPAQFVERTILSLLKYFGNFFKKLIDYKMYMCSVYVYMSISLCLDSLFRFINIFVCLCQYYTVLIIVVLS